jgi:type VI protein secretion system component Hcp
MVFTFKQLIITKYAIDGGSEEPTEDLAFAYTSLHVQYNQQKQDGSISRAGSWGYNLKDNKGAE